MLLAIPYLLAAAVFRDLIEGGGPEWLHLLVLLCIWNAMKLTVIGPFSLVLLIRTRVSEGIEQGASSAHANPRGFPAVGRSTSLEHNEDGLLRKEHNRL
ncbi:hypothetical protein K8P10_000802 [Leucobacter sp. Psy1]|nr:hypothetical protein K8P10_000802 [Leucobacter sp. Psy1]